ncbi:VanZ family protein [Saccharothrix sp. ST-888]|uniref:VanZ family protein n=1 Tax=Saccharothrix sp. ST-888 TaxID=1427391 RepID=UPI0012E00A7F|nr:VanZ family protein [Saccharothrix sp. ST-888]
MAALVALLVAAALVVRRPLVRQTGWAGRPALLLLLAAALCLGLTLPDQVVAGAPGRLGDCATGRGTRHLADGPGHQAVNVLLWLPLGLSGALATRRPFVVAAAASATWFAVELVQTLDPVRMCNPVDWLNNSLGSLAGALIGYAVLRHRSAGRERHRPSLS